jgi:Flp pilus assembly protein TadG
MGRSFIGRLFAAAQGHVGNLAQDIRGLSAVEFALILPIMITMYIGAVEFSHALTVDRRVTSVASAAADLTAQAEQVTSASMQDIFTASTSIMTPYSTAPISIVVTSVVADANNDTTVDWSCAYNGSPHSKGSGFSLPAGLTQPFSSVIVAEVTYNFMPTVGRYMTGGINMKDEFYLRPRRSLTVEMTGGGC